MLLYKYNKKNMNLPQIFMIKFLIRLKKVAQTHNNQQNKNIKKQKKIKCFSSTPKFLTRVSNKKEESKEGRNEGRQGRKDNIVLSSSIIVKW